MSKFFDVNIAPNAYNNEVTEYEKQPIERGKIVFYGCSDFTRWSTKWGNKPLEACILSHDGKAIAVNHGIGGSTVEHLLYEYPRLVRAWEPSALVFSAFYNDDRFGYEPEDVMSLTARVLDYARHDMPGIKLYITDMRPLLKTKKNHDTIYEAYSLACDKLVEDYCEKHDDTKLISLHNDPMFYESTEAVGDYMRCREDIYIDDDVHLNENGYKQFTSLFMRELKGAL